MCMYAYMDGCMDVRLCDVRACVCVTDGSGMC